MRKKKMWIFIALLFIFLLVFVGFFFYLSQKKLKELNHFIRSNIYLEYGYPLKETDIFIHLPKETYSFSTPLNEFVEVGDYNLTIYISNYQITCTIHIMDSTPPHLEVHPLTLYLDDEKPIAEDFVTTCEDYSECTYRPLDFKLQEGTQTVLITAYDSAGNQTSKETELTFFVDVEGPTFEGLTNLTITQGEKVDLKKNVRAIDTRFGEMDFLVDDSNVNYSQPGVYFILYSSTDLLGNITEKSRQITITKKETTYMISNFPTYSQYPNYPNGCEMISLYNLLRFYHVSVTPEQLVTILPKGKGPFWKDGTLFGGDPEYEFVGDPRDLHGYGVFQKPIIQMANQYKLGMIDYTGHSISEVLSLVKQQIPVQVWVSIGMKNTSVCATWIHPQTKKKIEWICNLHSVVIVGYNSTTIYASDPFTGKIEKYSYQQFQKMYDLFGKRAIYYAN